MSDTAGIERSRPRLDDYGYVDRAAAGMERRRADERRRFGGLLRHEWADRVLREQRLPAAGPDEGGQGRLFGDIP